MFFHSPKRAPAILHVASQAHDDGRAEWRRENGDKPRIEKTTDATWSAAHAGASELDIATTDYVDLPADWQRENRLSAERAVDEVLKAISNGRVLSDEYIEGISAVVHMSWVAPELRTPYAGLPEGEKEKSRRFVRRAMASLSATDAID